VFFIERITIAFLANHFFRLLPINGTDEHCYVKTLPGGYK